MAKAAPKKQPAKKTPPAKKTKKTKEESESEPEDDDESDFNEEEVNGKEESDNESLADEDEDIPVKKATKTKVKLTTKITIPAAAGQNKTPPKKTKPIAKKLNGKKAATPSKSSKKAASAKKKESKAKKEKKPKKEELDDEDEDGNMNELDTDLFLPGQKYPTPPDVKTDGTRLFYETLYQQKPTSKMAEKWCLEYGVLTNDKAQEVFNRLFKGGNKGGVKKK